MRAGALSRRAAPALLGAMAAASCAGGAGGALSPPLDTLTVSSAFGERRSGGRRHRGLDLRAPHGTPVAAARAGRVAVSGWQRGYGRVVVLDHGGGVETMYAHLSGAAVVPGDRVAARETIGYVGASGNATGPHLHFELRRNGVATDPARRFAR